MIIDKYEIDNESMLTIEVSIETNDIENFVQTKQKDLYANFEMKGYRKGHAPKEEFEKIYDSKSIVEKYFNELLQQIFIDVAKEKKITPIDTATPEILSENKIRFIIPVLPDIEIDLKKIEVNFKPTELTDKMLDDMIKDIQNKHPNLIEVDNPFVDGNTQTIDYEILDMKDNVIGKDVHFHLYGMDNEIVEDIFKYIKSMTKDDTKGAYIEIDHSKEKMPVNIKVTHVYTKELYPLDDEFPKKALNLNQNMEEYKTNLKKYMQNQINTEDQKHLEDIIVQKIDETTSDFKAPFKMIKEEKQHIQDDMNNKLLHHGMTLDMYLKNINKTIEQYNEDITKIANQRIKIQILLHKLAEKNNITVSKDDISTHIDSILEMYENPEYKSKLKDYLNTEERKQNIYGELLSKKIFDFIKAEIIIK